MLRDRSNIRRLSFALALSLALAPGAAPRAAAAAPIGEEVEVILKDGRRVSGRLLQELESRIKIEKPGPSVESIDRKDIAEILFAPDTDSRIVEIVAGIERLLAGQKEILDRLAAAPARPGAADAAPRRDGASAVPERAAPPDPDFCRAALGTPDRVVRDCFVGTAEGGPNPFRSEKWVYPAGAQGLAADEWRSVYFVNDVLVGSVIESSGSRMRPDPDLSPILRSAGR